MLVTCEIQIRENEYAATTADIVIDVTPKKNCPGSPMRNSARYICGG